MAKTFKVMKFNGDDAYSYAVFRTRDVRGLRSPVFYGQARPIDSGLTRRGAMAIAARLEREAGANTGEVR